MAGLEAKSLRTAKAYQMRLVLQDIYRSPTAGIVRHRFRVWCRWVRWAARKVPKHLLRAMVKVADLGGAASGRDSGALEVGPEQRLHGGAEHRSSTPPNARLVATAPPPTSLPGSTSPPANFVCLSSVSTENSGETVNST